MTAGTKLTLTGIANGGAGNYTYKYVIHNLITNNWSNLKDFSEASSYEYTAKTGTYDLCIVVKDESGKTVTSSMINVIAK